MLEFVNFFFWVTWVVWCSIKYDWIVIVIIILAYIWGRQTDYHGLATKKKFPWFIYDGFWLGLLWFANEPNFDNGLFLAGAGCGLPMSPTLLMGFSWLGFCKSSSPSSSLMVIFSKNSAFEALTHSKQQCKPNISTISHMVRPVKYQKLSDV